MGISFFEELALFEYDDTVIGNQIHLLIEYSQSYSFFNTVAKNIDSSASDAAYWAHLSNVTLTDLIIKWCKVFGTDDNELHWKKASVSNGYIDHIRGLIIGRFDNNLDSWGQYRKGVINFRNTYSAHRNVEEYAPVPFSSKSFEIAELYFNFLIDDLSPWSGHQPYLGEYFEVHEKIVLSKFKT
jgi:hypothetical protein